MIKIRKGNIEKIVTKGLYEELYESMGYEVVDSKKQAKTSVTDNKGEVEKIQENDILTETPPDSSMGDIGIPLFPFAKKFRMGPPVIATELVKIISEDFSENAKSIGEFKATGPYLNVKLDKASEASAILSRIFSQGSNYGKVNAKGEIHDCDDKRRERKG